MTNTLAFTYHRPLNPPTQFDLVPQHLPADVRSALTKLAEAVGAKAIVEEKLKTAAPADKPGLQEELTRASVAVDEAAGEYGTVGGASTTAIRDTAASAFVLAVESAAAGIRQAIDSLGEVGQAAALHASVRPGRAPVRLDTPAAADAPVRGQLVMLRSQLREVLAALPEDID